MTQWSHSVNCESQKRRPAPSWESPEARKRLYVFTYFYFISNTWNTISDFAGTNYSPLLQHLVAGRPKLVYVYIRKQFRLWPLKYGSVSQIRRQVRLEMCGMRMRIMRRDCRRVVYTTRYRVAKSHDDRWQGGWNEWQEFYVRRPAAVHTPW